MTWILIILMFGSGKAVNHVEFNNKTACFKAKEQINQARGVYLITYCVGKD